MNNKEIKYFENTPNFQIFSINKFEKDEIISYEKSIRCLVADLCGLEILNEKELCLLIGDMIDFPVYYGGNWDALIECLGDLDWSEDEDIMGAIVLVDKRQPLLGKEAGIKELAKIMEISHERLYSLTDSLLGPKYRTPKLFIVGEQGEEAFISSFHFTCVGGLAKPSFFTL